MTDVITDTSPLIFLSKIKRLDLLSCYKIIVPRQVEEEILKGYKKHHKDASLIMKFLKSPNVTKVDVNTIDTLPTYFGKGEQAVISYAVDIGIKDVLIDEETPKGFKKVRATKTNKKNINDDIKIEKL
ncbi:MAG: hypothetical protein K8F52_08085 [Candidatus Scalindua rubra]|uniref:PIN domain-containing protein n=1 Tax=Candidatus Scalindua brodae TaxID=237368 RepID=A0A0B0EQN0_9BACT|nr:MAG: hypothetical protein SCABRO_00065 [Candidatus Scalindua brodae]MBZ0108616.1 hypothetical protein [Candidatus Scalindua rubra]TWU38184.1 hypothetical protein S225a_02310 [Candidatus Brocadiaceae bacterium S225]